jgi:alpha-L-glutamate ligase-like protein
MNFLQKIKFIRQNVLGINQRNLGYIYPNNDRRDYELADDKCIAKSIMEKHGLKCPETYAVIASMGEIESAWKMIQHHTHLVAKPAKGSGGNGILILRREGEQWFSGSRAVSLEDIFTHIANCIFGIYSFGDSDKVLVEEYVRPHSFFAEMYHDGVPDFRIILFKNIPVLGMLRMPTDKSDGKANLHQGGLGIGVCLDRGILTHTYDGAKYSTFHPDSHQTIFGRKVPFWNEMLALSIEASKAFPLNYLGVDIVIDQDKGPLIMEVNVRPGLGIQLANKMGLKAVLTKI